jgi:lysylphosphatidylglycerol synthetase-like protein (DUF2156 family)
MPDSLIQAFRELWNPQYQHVVLLPFLVHGLILTGLMALGSAILKQHRACALALLLMAVCAAAAQPYLDARAASLSAIQAAQTKYEATEVAALGERLHSQIWIFHAVAGLAVLAALGELIRWQAVRFLGIGVALIGMAAGCWALDFHYRESRVYHSNLMPAARTRAPAPTPSTPAAPDTPRVEPARPLPNPGR